MSWIYQASSTLMLSMFLLLPVNSRPFPGEAGIGNHSILPLNDTESRFPEPGNASLISNLATTKPADNGGSQSTIPALDGAMREVANITRVFLSSVGPHLNQTPTIPTLTTPAETNPQSPGLESSTAGPVSSSTNGSSSTTGPLSFTSGSSSTPEHMSSTNGSSSTTGPVSFTSGSSSTPEVMSSTNGSSSTTGPLSFTSGSSSTPEHMSSTNGSSSTTGPVSFTSGSSSTPELMSSTNGSSSTTGPVSFTSGSSSTPELMSSTNGSSSTTGPLSFTSGSSSTPELMSSTNGSSSTTGPVSFTSGSSSTPELTSSTNGSSSTFGPTSRTNGSSSTFGPTSRTNGSSFTSGPKNMSWLFNVTGHTPTNGPSPTTAVTNSSWVLIPRMHPGRNPEFTSIATTTLITPKERPSEGSNPCSPTRRNGLVSQCLIAIVSLAGVATIFMVCSIVLCTKLSAQKHRYKVQKGQCGTEMVCISALLPDGNGPHGRPRIPKSNGALIPNADGDSDGEDDLTLNSFLPDI